jgi:hypothetical protein
MLGLFQVLENEFEYNQIAIVIDDGNRGHRIEGNKFVSTNSSVEQILLADGLTKKTTSAIMILENEFDGMPSGTDVAIHNSATNPVTVYSEKNGNENAKYCALLTSINTIIERRNHWIASVC